MRQVALMPSTSKSPKTAICSPPSMAARSRPTTSAMPGMRKGSAQSRSNEGERKSLACCAVVIPRPAMMRAARGDTRHSSAMRRAASGS